MTLGCGSWGGNVTSDNISPRHLLDVKRIAFETRPINDASSEIRPTAATYVPDYSEPAARPHVDVQAIELLVDRFLAERDASKPPGTVNQQPPPAVATVLSSPTNGPQASQAPPSAAPPEIPPAVTAASNGHVSDFVCEDDVKRAIRTNQKIYINAKTIITPAARDLGDEHDVFARPQ